MRTNPFSDALDFLTQGEWTSYVFALLVLASVVIAAVNLWRDASSALGSACVELAGPILYRRAVVATVLVEASSHLH